MPTQLHAFTVDVEDYFHVSGFDQVVPRAVWDEQPARLERGLDVVLDLLAQVNVRGTFFILGAALNRHSAAVRRIADAGHELACHSYWHRLIYRLTPSEFAQDTREAKDRIEQLSGQPVWAYRAPSFSITTRSLWALEVLASLGFRLDSSIFPTRHDRYGIPHAPIAPYVVQTPSGPIAQFPPTVCRLGRMNLPAGGGGYLRIYPFALTRALLRKVGQAGRAVNLYIHPWEFDPQQPRQPGLGALSAWRHYANLNKTADRIRQLLGQLSFGPVSAVLRGYTDPVPVWQAAGEQFQPTGETAKLVNVLPSAAPAGVPV